MNLFARLDEQQESELVRLDPKNVRVWSGNARQYELLNRSNCADVIESIAVEGRNTEPVTVRRLPDDPSQLELVAGTRRHFSVSYLREHGYPEIWLRAQVRAMTDEEAFRISDAENSKRSDVSVIERARNYAWALEEFYDGKQRDLATSIGRKESWLSKELSVAAIPDEVLAAFASPNELVSKDAYKLARALKDEERRSAILRRAKEIADEKATSCGEPIPAKKVLGRLLANENVPAEKAIQVWSTLAGEAYLTLRKNDAQGLHFLVPAGAEASIWQVKEAFEEALIRHR